jgi:hypothetical protein
MSTDLETRRRAIADALRAIMAEPMPRRAAAPTVDVAPQPGEDPPEPPAPELVLVPARGEPDDWLVPPLEAAGSMSRTASLALFGHA